MPGPFHLGGAGHNSRRGRRRQMRRIGVGAAVALVAMALAGCARSSLRPDYERIPSESLAVGEATAIGRAFAPVLANHPGDSGFVMLDDNVVALLARLAG